MTSSASRPDPGRTSDVIIVGDGIIGLAITLELATRGLRCRVLGARRAGVASTAAAGLLAPSVAELPPDVRPFVFGSRDRFPAFLERLREFDPSLSMVGGLLQIPPTADEALLTTKSTLIDQSQLASLEPSLAHLSKAILHPRDGAVDNVRLLAATSRAVASVPATELSTDDPVALVDCSGRNAVARTESGAQYSAAKLVLAAGAWSSQLRGLPRRVPLKPLKGQMLALAASPLRHAVMSPNVYLVPRGSETLVGATSEDAGFDVATTESALSRLRSAADALCPALVEAPVTRSWAGFRPSTPDMLPILGPDPDCPSLVYACGHSRNGILLAPATAELIGALLTGEAQPFDVTPFRVDRFGSEIE